MLNIISSGTQRRHGPFPMDPRFSSQESLNAFQAGSCIPERFLMAVLSRQLNAPFLQSMHSLSASGIEDFLQGFQSGFFVQYPDK